MTPGVPKSLTRSGAIGIETVGARWLGLIGAAFIAIALVIAEVASSRINAARSADVLVAS
jgi:hypothetical protein